MDIEKYQLEEVYSHAPAALLGHSVVASFIIYILFGSVPVDELGYWSVAMLMILVFRMIAIYRYREAQRSVNIDKFKWLLALYISVFFTGGLWGVSTYFADYLVTTDLHLIIMSIGFAMAGAAVSTLGAIFSAYVLFTIPMLSIIAVSMITSNEPLHLEMGYAIFLGIAFLLNAAYKHGLNFKEVSIKTKEVERTQLDIVERLGTAGEYRDNETGLHIKRMSYCSYLLAQQAGFSENKAEQILAASPMHDVGKIGIPDNILLKPGKLTKDEFEIMKTHTTIGVSILENHESELMQLAALIAGCHHEKWDGSGYPNGLSGEDIPKEARIVSICDVFDALTSVRPYKKAWSMEDALEFIEAQSGKHFDPELVEHFLQISPQVIEYTNLHQDSNESFKITVAA